MRLLVVLLSILFAGTLMAGEPLQPVGGVSVKSSVLASQVGADLKPLVATRLFKASDTVHLVVSTSAAGTGVDGSLGVAWRYVYEGEEMAVHSEGRELIFAGDGRTMFEVSKPDGWPAGAYAVEVFLNGEAIEKLHYRVN